MTAPFRGREHAIQAKVNQCRHCDAISTTPKQAETISAQVRDAHRQWISSEFKKARKELGFTIDSLAAATGIARATIGRASSGGSLIEASLEDLLWLRINEMREKNLKSWMATSHPGEARIYSETTLVSDSLTNSASTVLIVASRAFCSTSPINLRGQDPLSNGELQIDYEYEGQYA